ncbi:MAG: hypothetical protein Q4F57_01460 [Weeksellaceae bacterium]|nr:hypothetical protein [Weeksellaceae bacterium]
MKEEMLILNYPNCPWDLFNDHDVLSANSSAELWVLFRDERSNQEKEMRHCAAHL